MAEFSADEDVTFKNSKKKSLGKPSRVRGVGRPYLREISNSNEEDYENEATVELGAMMASMGSHQATNKKMVYTEEDMQKAEAVSKEAVAIADSLLSRAEGAEREVATLKKAMGEWQSKAKALEEENKAMSNSVDEKVAVAKQWQSKAKALEEENKAMSNSVDEKVAVAKQKVYEKVKEQFTAGNKEFQRVKNEHEKKSKEIEKKDKENENMNLEIEKMSKELVDMKKRLEKEIESTKHATKSQKEAIKKKRESREIYFIGLIKEILSSTTAEALKVDKNDTKLLSDAKTAIHTMKEKLSTASKLQSSNRGLLEKLKASEQAVKDAANVESSLFASKNELEKELMAAKQNIQEQAKMNEQLVEMLEKSSGL
jgi:myosin heavy subunit